MSNDLIARRSLLECAVRVAALPAGVAFLRAWSQAAQQGQHVHRLPGGAAPPAPNQFSQYRPQFFSSQDYQALQAITALLIPTDETPGAREAHCSEFIDFILFAAKEHSPETASQWRTAMGALKEAGFHDANAEGQAKLLAAMAEPERNRQAHHPAFDAYRLIKRETVFAFYTAREGMIESLDYRGNSFNLQFPACTHPEHQQI